MLDIKFIRENKDLIVAGIQKRNRTFDIDELLKIDDERIALLQKVETQRGKQNMATEAIANLSGTEKQKKIQEMQTFKIALSKDEDALKGVLKKWRELMLKVPNLPDTTVPEGKDENDNKKLKIWGIQTEFNFSPKGHIELMEKLSMVDFSRGSKVHGFRGYFLKNDGALLSWAIWNYAQDFFLKKGFTPFIAPAIVKKEYFYGTGHLPNDAEDLYTTQDGDCLSGTAEVPMMAYHANEILDKKNLPIKYLAFSPCYRREAGSYGKDTKGLIRVHEFFKLEQLILCEANHEESVKYHEEINRNTEEFIESLEIPYRQLEICTGDLKSAQVKSYDIELWIPSEKTYREISSASYYHDFQTRRFNVRYNDNGKKHYTHSLNGTAIPTPRILVALIENNQKEDGSIGIPKVLQKYFGKDKIV